MSRQFRSDDTDKWKYGFGDGHDAATYSVPANAGIATVSAGGFAITLDSASSFANGDLVLIHQTRGTGAGNWELNKIASGGGTTSITLKHALMNSYTDSGASQAQIIELKEYNGLTVSTTINAPVWDGNKGGIIAFLDKATCTISGTLSATGKGFRGGPAVNYNTQRGEGTGGDRGGTTQSANGSGGGGGGGGAGAGGSGGHANAGNVGGGNTGAEGGLAVGNSSLTSINFGGAGASSSSSNSSQNGGEGGGIIIIFAKNIVNSSLIDASGITKPQNNECSGPSGAGGSILLKCVTATLGSSTITSTSPTPPATNWDGGRGSIGSVGRIHLDYSGSYTGTTSPAIDVRQDLTIKPVVGLRPVMIF